MTPGRTDLQRRERLRSDALPLIQARPKKVEWWAVRVTIRRALGKRPLDIENTLKPILDAFCARQVRRDKSRYPAAGLYEDDSIDHVRVIQVEGHRGPSDETQIQILACVA
ncbi:MAG TPA: hypothetical protein VNL98_11385 [Gemmatimonadales bacterium]|nr:hypothetical protein [Gemmatimonadales bacterium]